MKKANAFLWVVAAAILCVNSSPAQSKPDFTGEWKLDASKSSFGQMPPPDTYVRKIEHKEPKVHVSTTQTGAQGEFSMTADYLTDGTETTNDFMGGTQAKSSAKWDGNALNITTKFDFNGEPITVAEKWSLSGDGKVLTVAIHFSSSQGEGDATIVTNKQ